MEMAREDFNLLGYLCENYPWQDVLLEIELTSTLRKNMILMAKKFILTKEGLEAIKNEYGNLVNTKRPQITQRIRRAREFGDLSENSEYDAA